MRTKTFKEEVIITGFSKKYILNKIDKGFTNILLIF